MTVTTHMCRGNFRSSWAAEGGYDFVAEALFGELDVRRLLPGVRRRALRRLRAAAVRARRASRSCSGSSRPSAASSRARTSSSAASRRPRGTSPLDQLCLSPQCGFSSTVGGQRAHRGRAEGQAAARRRDGAGGLGIGAVGPVDTQPWEYPDSLDAMVAAPGSPPCPARERRRAGAGDQDRPGGDRAAPHASLAEHPLHPRDRPPRASRCRGQGHRRYADRRLASRARHHHVAAARLPHTVESVDDSEIRLLNVELKTAQERAG